MSIKRSERSRFSLSLNVLPFFFFCISIESLLIFIYFVGKKNKKIKGKTLGLTEFLSDGGAPPGQKVVTRKTSNWADDVENEDGKCNKNLIALIIH